MTQRSWCGSGGQDHQNRATIAHHDRGWPGRVLLVAPTSTGGIGAHVRDLADGLLRAGHEVVLAAPAQLRARLEVEGLDVKGLDVEGWDAERAESEPLGPERLDAIRHVPVTVGRWAGSDPVAVHGLRRLLPGADVVHAHGWRAGAVAALAARGAASVPLVVTLHNAPPHRGALPDPLSRLVLARADTVLAGSADLAALARRSGARQVQPAVLRAPERVRPLPEEVARLRDELAPAGHRLVVVIARLAPQKGLDVLLEAVRALVHPEEPAPHAGPSSVATPAGHPAAARLIVVVAGEGPLRARLQRRLDRGRLPVRLLGHRDDVPALLAAADLVVCPSRWEGPSLAVQEALRLGRAVVAADVGGIGELVGGAALLVRGGDAVALAHGIQQVLGDDGRRKSLERKALQRARQLPSQDDVVAATVAAYRRAAGATPRGRAARRRG